MLVFLLPTVYKNKEVFTVNDERINIASTHFKIRIIKSVEIRLPFIDNRSRKLELT